MFWVYLYSLVDFSRVWLWPWPSYYYWFGLGLVFYLVFSRNGLGLIGNSGFGPGIGLGFDVVLGMVLFLCLVFCWFWCLFFLFWIWSCFWIIYIYIVLDLWLAQVVPWWMGWMGWMGLWVWIWNYCMFKLRLEPFNKSTIYIF